MTSNPAETSATFTTRFYNLLLTINDRCTHATTEQDVQTLRTLISQARVQCSCGTEWWVGYELRKAQQALQEAERHVDTAVKRIRPRSRFRFRQRPSANQTTTINHTPPPTTHPMQPQHSPPPQHNTVVIDTSTLHNKLAVAQGQDGQDVTIRGLTDAQVVVPFCAGAMQLTDIHRCRIMVRNVNGSMHATRMKACHMWVCARQVRLHECEECTVWVEASGAPVIEACYGMRFGALWDVGKGKAAWKGVADFLWLREDEDSPNWKRVSGVEGRVWWLSDGRVLVGEEVDEREVRDSAAAV